MTESPTTDLEGIVIERRTIPTPRTISPEAQGVLAALINSPGLPAFPDLGDTQAWVDLIETFNHAALAMPGLRDPGGVTGETRTIAGVTVFQAAPTRAADDVNRRVLLDIHGGALILMGGDICRMRGVVLAAELNAQVFSPDYRVAPTHPYPAALDDCIGVYRGLLDEFDPADIIINGWSAGSNLAAATVLRARDEGLPMPAAIVLPSPELDLTESGDTFQVMRDIDVVLKRSLMPINLLYAGGADLSDPYLSPLFGDFTRGFPPTFLQAGTRDMFLSNAARMHRALLDAGVPAELHVFEAMPHGGFSGTTPEDQTMMRAIRKFVDRHWTA